MSNLGNKLRGLKEIWQFDNRLHLALNRLLFPAETIQIYRYKGLEVLVDHAAGDANGAREVLTSDMYRRYLPLMDLGRNIKILDVGANNGGFPLLLKASGIEIGQLVSVELNPFTAERLRFNMSRNFDRNFSVLNCAMTGERREIQFSPGKLGSVSDNIYSNREDGHTEAFQIAGLTFNDIYERFYGDSIVDVCKIDVEGAEFEMVDRGTCSRLRNCRYLLIEIHHEPKRPRGKVLTALHDLGFAEIDGEAKHDGHHHVHFLLNQHLAPLGSNSAPV